MFRYYAQHSSLFSKFSDNSKLPDSICQRTTGFNRQQFEELSGDLISLRNTSSRSKSQVLAIFLFWLKTGLDQYSVADYFDIDSHFEVSRYLQQVRDAFVKDFILNNLGVGHLTRSEWLANNSELAKEIFNAKESQLILVIDGTYCYCQKSSNSYFQRKTFSVQKKTHLVKPFLFSTSNGKIVDVLGSFFGNKK